MAKKTRGGWTASGLILGFIVAFSLGFQQAKMETTRRQNEHPGEDVCGLSAFANIGVATFYAIPGSLVGMVLLQCLSEQLSQRDDDSEQNETGRD